MQKIQNTILNISEKVFGLHLEYFQVSTNRKLETIYDFVVLSLNQLDAIPFQMCRKSVTDIL